MKYINITPLMAGLCLCGTMMFSSTVMASDAIKKMAGIMINLNHYPSSQGKATLKKLLSSKSMSANERALATAMLNLDHKTIDSDKPALQKILEGEASSAEKDLAQILLNLSHKPSSGDKSKLQAMMQ